ncbi:hypothetical protein JW707_03120 [Candidatus Woesearchaeota archaeon]|nr:hypothetical protein [Candidatus Woesearchaeota archaeon]
MKTITKIGVMSVAKIQALLTGVMYLLMGLVATIVGIRNPEIIQQAGLQAGWGYVLTYTITGLVGGFILGLVIAYLYNLLAPKIGGIQIEIK